MLSSHSSAACLHCAELNMSVLSHATTCREKLGRPGEGARTSCARAKHKCPHPLCGSTGVLCCSTRQWCGSSVRTTVLSNHKMEASRLLQCNSVCILMFVAQLMWLDMRAKVKTEHLRRAQFSAHMSLNTMFAAHTCSRFFQCLCLPGMTPGSVAALHSVFGCMHG